MQLDLFTHSRDVGLRNDAIAALRWRDADAARKSLEALSTQYPGDGLIDTLAILLRSFSDPPGRFPDPAVAAEAVLGTDCAIVPAARRAFGEDAGREWLVPLWRSLANAAAGLPFDAERPEAHAAAMLLRSGDWALAEARVADIASWRRRPAPLAWMAEARFGQAGLDSAWCLLAELAWIDAPHFGTLARRLESHTLHRFLDDFDGGFEPDGDAELAWFPAWALIAEPALATSLRDAQVCNDTAPERAARLVMEILALERQGRHADLVALRRRLREVDSRLFSRYMSTR